DSPHGSWSPLCAALPGRRRSRRKRRRLEGFAGGARACCIGEASLRLQAPRWEARMEKSRLERQLQFILEIDKAKQILRRTLLLDLAGEMRALWDEFEAAQSAEARFAYALDRFQPLLHNYHTQGATWQKHGITHDRVIAVNQRIADGAPELWEYARALIEDAV